MSRNLLVDILLVGSCELDRGSFLLIAQDVHLLEPRVDRLRALAGREQRGGPTWESQPHDAAGAKALKQLRQLYLQLNATVAKRWIFDLLDGDDRL